MKVDLMLYGLTVAEAHAVTELLKKMQDERPARRDGDDPPPDDGPGGPGPG